MVEHPHRGTFVREFSAQDHIDIYNFRLVLELAAAPLFPSRGLSLERLDRVLPAMRKAATMADEHAPLVEALRAAYEAAAILTVMLTSSAH